MGLLLGKAHLWFRSQSCNLCWHWFYRDMAEIPWLCFLGLPKRGRKIKAKKTENLKRDLPWLPAQAGAFSNQTKGLMPKRKKIEKGGKLGEEERKGVKEEEKEG